MNKKKRYRKVCKNLNKLKKNQNKRKINRIRANKQLIYLKNLQKLLMNKTKLYNKASSSQNK